jgi:hypothetical protein
VKGLRQLSPRIPLAVKLISGRFEHVKKAVKRTLADSEVLGEGAGMLTTLEECSAFRSFAR